MPETTNKKPAFYPLTEQEIVDLALGGFKKSEILVYLYHRRKAYNGTKGRTMDTALIAERLGMDRRTIQKALKALVDKGYLVIELRTYDYICPRNYREQKFVSANRNSPNGEQKFAEANKNSPTISETPSQSEPQKSRDYKRIYNNLSTRERENFLYYVESCTTSYKTKIVCLEDWLFSKTSAGNLRIAGWWKKYQSHLAKQAKIQAKKSSARANSGITSFSELQSDNQGKSIQNQLTEQEVNELLEETRRMLGRGKKH